ncbi:MAG: hypothetical protein WD993_08605 [Thermoleophilaceae bacterium]
MAAAMAFTAPSAFAAVEVEDSASGTMCDNTTAGYCEINWGADLATLTVHTIFGEVNYTCDWSIPTHVQSDGSGSTESVSITNETGGTGNCNDATPCEQPWPKQFTEVAGSVFVQIRVCFDLIVRCEGVLHSPAMTDTGNGYAVEIASTSPEGDGDCEVSGHAFYGGIRVVHD